MADGPIRTLTANRDSSSTVDPRNGVGSPPGCAEEDADATRLRGIVALPYKRDILFADEVELKLEKLPRWQPQIIVDERRITDDEHD
jgi:hypothetical protein